MLKNKKYNDYIYEPNIVDLLNEIEFELGEYNYNELLVKGINKCILNKVRDIIFIKYKDEVDIIKLNLKNYIKDIELKNDFFKLSSFMPLAYTMLFFVITQDYNLRTTLTSISIIILLVHMFKKQDKHMNEYNKRFKLANIVLDIIAMDENNFKCNSCKI